MKITWQEIEELIKKTYGIKTVVLTRRSFVEPEGRELDAYPDYVEGE